MDIRDRKRAITAKRYAVLVRRLHVKGNCCTISVGGDVAVLPVDLMDVLDVVERGQRAIDIREREDAALGDFVDIERNEAGAEFEQTKYVVARTPKQNGVLDNSNGLANPMVRCPMIGSPMTRCPMRTHAIALAVLSPAVEP